LLVAFTMRSEEDIYRLLSEVREVCFRLDLLIARIQLERAAWVAYSFATSAMMRTASAS
jgi:hypothetical protein